MPSIPRHIAIIMDGNGRWARGKGLERLTGHERGAEAVRDCVKGCLELGVEYLTLYAFSTENWKRPKDEVDAIMRLLYDYLCDAERKLAGQNVKIRVIGDRSRLSDKINEAILHAEDISKNTVIPEKF